MKYYTPANNENEAIYNVEVIPFLVDNLLAATLGRRELMRQHDPRWDKPIWEVSVSAKVVEP